MEVSPRQAQMEASIASSRSTARDSYRASPSSPGTQNWRGTRPRMRSSSSTYAGTAWTTCAIRLPGSIGWRLTGAATTAGSSPALRD